MRKEINNRKMLKEYYVIWRVKYNDSFKVSKMYGKKQRIRIELKNKGYLVTYILSEQQLDEFMSSSYREIYKKKRLSVERYDWIRNWIHNGCKCQSVNLEWFIDLYGEE